MNTTRRHNNRRTALGRKVVLALTLLMLLTAQKQASAQIFIIDEQEYLNNERNRVTEDLPNIPFLGSTLDQYAPLGGGWLLLSGLGGLYLWGKGRKKKE